MPKLDAAGYHYHIWGGPSGPGPEEQQPRPGGHVNAYGSGKGGNVGGKKTILILTFKIPLDGEYNLTSPTTIRQQMCLPTLLLASLMMAVMDRACVIRNSGGKLLIAIDLILPPTLKILKCN